MLDQHASHLKAKTTIYDEFSIFCLSYKEKNFFFLFYLFPTSFEAEKQMYIAKQRIP